MAVAAGGRRGGPVRGFDRRHRRSSGGSLRVDERALRHEGRRRRQETIAWCGPLRRVQLLVRTTMSGESVSASRGDAPRDVLLHLCRLRYFRNEEAWSMAFYTYSHEKYEPSMFSNGTFHGTPEEGFEMAAI